MAVEVSLVDFTKHMTELNLRLQGKTNFFLIYTLMLNGCSREEYYFNYNYVKTDLHIKIHVNYFATLLSFEPIANEIRIFPNPLQ